MYNNESMVKEGIRILYRVHIHIWKDFVRQIAKPDDAQEMESIDNALDAVALRQSELDWVIHTQKRRRFRLIAAQQTAGLRKARF